MTPNKLHVSEGNSKIGRIPSVSLPPLVTCVENPPCARLCYARKAYEGYSRNMTGPAWRDNLAYYTSDPDGYFDVIVANLRRRKLPADRRYFRWHVGGEIVDRRYYEGILRVAVALPDWQFLAYSRHYWAWSEPDDFTSGMMPQNLRVLRSLWIGEWDRSDVSPWKAPWFKVLDKDQPVPADGVLCPGSCVTCKRCWHIECGSGTYIYLH